MTCNLIIYLLIPYKFIINHRNDIPAFVQETNNTMYTYDTNLHKAFRTSHGLKIEIGNNSCFLQSLQMVKKQ